MPPQLPPSPPAAAFDWESMLGVRGAAWLAGVTLVIAAILFAKWSVDQGYFAVVFTPLVRVILMVAAGTVALVWAELGLRRGYAPTADAVSGVGIVVLYAAWFSAHATHGLIGVTPAFVAMSVVTVVAAAISVRREALFTAILGVLGGIATPLLLSSGTDRPLGLFSYLALLNLGFLFVARRRAWAIISGLTLGGTLLLQLGWMAARLREETLPIAIGAFAVLGGLYVWHAVATRDDDPPASHAIGLIGSAVPFVLSILLAADPRFTASWGLVFANVVLLDVAAIAVGLWRLRALVAISAITTAIAFAIWPLVGRAEIPAAGPTLVVLGLTALYNVLGRIGVRATDTAARPVLSLLGTSGLVVAGGLYLFTLTVMGRGITFAGGAPSPEVAVPTALVLAVTGLLFLVLIERTTVDVAPLVLPAGAFALGVLAWRWFELSAAAGSYVGLMAFGHLLALAFAGVALVRDRIGVEDDAEWYLRSDMATLAGVAVAYVSLLGAADRLAFASPAPLFGLLAFDLALILLVAIRRSWTALVPMAAVAAWVFASAWHVQHFSKDTAPVAVGAEIAIYLTFVVLPFILVAFRPRVWRLAVGAWLTSAFIGPAFFVIFRAAWVELWGTGSIGALSVILAGVSVASLAGVGRVFAAADDPEGAGRRLNYLALFAAIALGFVATAIAMQLDRQWITIGWALEAAAVFWVFGLVPHPGLKYLGLLLFGAVAARLLVNPEVLLYEPRGRPIVNWLLYTYGVPVLCTFAGGWLLRRAEARRVNPPDYDWAGGDRAAFVPIVGGLGVLLLFWLINLEIFDFFAVSRYLEVDLSRHFQRDLTFSCAWGLYALALLGAGIWRGQKGLRLAALGFLLLTVAKVFLYDLDVLTGLYRILSFVGLGTALLLVSLLYQRFVRTADK